MFIIVNLSLKKIMVEVTEKKIAGTTMQIVMDEEGMVSILSRKKSGRKADHSHELTDVYEMFPPLIMEVRDRRSIDEAMSPMLLSAVTLIWEIAAEIDPWFLMVLEG